MPDDAAFGVTPEGFVLKGIDTVLAEHQRRAREMFGDDVDLGSGSALRKVIDAVAFQAHDVWKGLEDQYYATFMTTADGPSLDLLGEDVGTTRQAMLATGTAELTLVGGAQGRAYALPEGTLLESAAGVPVRTLAPVTLTGPGEMRPVPAQAMVRGTSGDLAAGQLTRVSPEFAAAALDLGPATVAAANPDPFAGGTALESDPEYRSRMRNQPRTLWTLDGLLKTVLDLDGVRDASVFDTAGGVDVSQSVFNLFSFGQRTFAAERPFASPYYFDVVVATVPGWPWRTLGGVTGRFEAVTQALSAVRPVSIFPNVVQANQVEIGVRATLVVEPGQDAQAILAEIADSIRRHVSGLTLGRDVLYSDVLVLARRATGVLDVQNLHLRRCPAVFGEITFAGALFRQPVEVAVGENVELGPDEIPYFSIDSQLIDLEVLEP